MKQWQQQKQDKNESKTNKLTIREERKTVSISKRRWVFTWGDVVCRCL